MTKSSAFKHRNIVGHTTWSTFIHFVVYIVFSRPGWTKGLLYKHSLPSLNQRYPCHFCQKIFVEKVEIVDHVF